MWGNVMFITALQYVVDMKAFRDALKNLGMAIALGFSANNPIPDWVYQMVTNPTLGNYFMLSIPVAAVERIVFTAIATVISVGVIMAIGRLFFARSEA